MPQARIRRGVSFGECRAGVFAALCILLFALPGIAASGRTCFRVGETVTVVGQFDDHVFLTFNAGGFPPQPGPCFEIYEGPYRVGPITTAGHSWYVEPFTEQTAWQDPKTYKMHYAMPNPQHLPFHAYVEVTGKVGYTNGGLLMLKVETFRSVDAQVKALCAAWEQDCKRWQDENISAFSAQPHHGSVERIVRPDSGLKCGLSMLAEDPKGAHTVATMRPEQIPTAPGCIDPVVIYKPPPPNANAPGPRAHIIATGMVDDAGRVSDVSFTLMDLKPSPYDRSRVDWGSEYRKIVMENLLQWKLRPANCNGQPVKKSAKFEFYIHYPIELR
jgi:hypothetical protein